MELNQFQLSCGNTADGQCRFYYSYTRPNIEIMELNQFQLSCGNTADGQCRFYYSYTRPNIEIMELNQFKLSWGYNADDQCKRTEGMSFNIASTAHKSYRDEIETLNREEIPFSSQIVPRGLSVADYEWHNATHLYSD